MHSIAGVLVTRRARDSRASAVGRVRAGGACVARPAGLCRRLGLAGLRCPPYDPPMTTPPGPSAGHDRIRVALCQLDLARRGPRRQRRGDGGGVPACRDRAVRDVAVFPELAICGYPPEDLVLKPGFVEHCQHARSSGSRCWSTDTARRSSAGSRVTGSSVPTPTTPTTGPGTPRPSCTTDGSWAATASRRCRTTACSTRSATSIPGTPTSRCSAIGGVRCRGHRVRGRLGRRRAGGRGRPCRGVDRVEHQRLAVPPGKQRERASDAAADRVADSRHADRLREPGRRPGRAGLRRRIARLDADGEVDCRVAPLRRGGRPSSTSPSSRRSVSAPRAVVEVDRIASTRDPSWAPPRWSRRRRWRPTDDSATGRGVVGAGARGARLRHEERLRRRGDRAVGRRRLVDRRGDRGRRARSGPGARRADAVAVLERPLARRRRGAARTTSASTAGPSRSVPPTTRSNRCSRRRSRAASRTSPRRTCSRGSVACCSWRCRTSSAGWCSPRATRARRRWATRRCTATPPAGSPSSRTCPSCWSTSCAAGATRRGTAVIIPRQVLTKAPSAELRPDQRDDQSLPPYEVLDPLIEAYVDGDLTASGPGAAGHDPDVVERIIRLVDRGRVQAPTVAARHPDLVEGLRPGPAPADHQLVLRVRHAAREPGGRVRLGRVCRTAR